MERSCSAHLLLHGKNLVAGRPIPVGAADPSSMVSAHLLFTGGCLAVRPEDFRGLLPPFYIRRIRIPAAEGCPPGAKFVLLSCRRKEARLFPFFSLDSFLCSFFFHPFWPWKVFSATECTHVSQTDGVSDPTLHRSRWELCRYLLVLTYRHHNAA